MKFTLLGSSGFIGSHLSKYLQSKSIDCFLPSRDYVFSKNENLGHVIYCIGLTADFREKPMETVKAHVSKLVEVLENSNFESFLYLSSSRLYSGCETGKEDVSFKVNPSDFSDLYNISKLMGEATCLSTRNKKIRIARLSNVIGNDFKSDNFLFSLIKDAIDKGTIRLAVPLKAAKDYISIDDVIKLIELIALSGKQSIYNVASGVNITNEQLTEEIKKFTGCTVEILKSSGGLVFPLISVEKIKHEFSFEPKDILTDIYTLIQNYKLLKNDRN